MPSSLQFRRASLKDASVTMDGVKISELPAASTTADADQFEVNQGGTSRSVTRGQVFAPLACRTTAITYYVATTGSDTNDGSLASPCLTFQRALDMCAATAAYSRGPFTIQAAAGTYTVLTRLTYTAWLFIGSPVTFAGHVTGGIPDTVIQGSTDGTRTHNFHDVSGAGLQFIYQDIYFHSFNQPVTVTQFGRVTLTRCWIKNVRNGLAAGNGGFAAASGGDWDGRDLAGVQVEDGNAFGSVIVSPFNLTQPNDYSGLLLHHWVDGVLVDECGSGHMDYLRIEDCTNGVHITRGGGSANMRFARIWRCTRGVLAQSASQVFVASSFDFGQGTANACGTNIVYTAAPVAQQEEETVYSTRPVFLVYQNTTSGNLTNAVAERDMWTRVIGITQGRVRAQDVLDIHMYVHGILTVAGTLRLYFGATLAQAWTVPAGMTDARIEIMLEALNATDWRGQIFQLAGPAGTPAPSLVPITDKLGLTSLTAYTELRLTWQAAALTDFFQMRTGRVFSSIAGLGFN